MRAWIVVCVLSSSAIARAGGTLEGDVLVWDDATFYVEPADDAPTIKLASLDNSSMPAIVGHAVPMRVVGRNGDFVEVEPVADGQCDGVTLQAAHVDHLHLFVKDDAHTLAPVLVKPWRASFDNGSRVELGVGTPVAPLDGGGVAFQLDGVVLHADVPAASIGRAYPPITPSSLAAPDPRFELVDGTAGSVGGETYVVPRTLLPHSAHAIEHPRKDVSRFPIRMRCGEVDVVVPDDAVGPYKPAGLGEGIGVGSRTPAIAYRIPKGTPLSTKAGRDAGVAAETFDVEAPPAGATKACFDAHVSLGRSLDAPTGGEEWIAGNTITLCAPVARQR